MSLTAVTNIPTPAALELPTTPYLVLDIEQAVGRYRAVETEFGPRAVHYAVKANPHPELVAALVRAGSRFDVASAGEVESLPERRSGTGST